jgi:hypothetical protein
MPRVVPSDFVKFIATVWPNRQELINVNRYYAGQLSGLVDLVEQIPSEPFVVGSASYALLVCGVAHIRQKLSMWANELRMQHELGVIPGSPP